MKFHIPDTKEFSVRSKQSAQKNLIKSPPPHGEGNLLCLSALYAVVCEDSPWVQPAMSFIPHRNLIYT